MVLGTILSGIVLMLFGGRLFLTALDHARLRPVSTILIAVITLILVPAIAIILAATGVGIPIGLALLLALPLLFIFGQPIAAAGIAAGVFVRSPGPIGIARALLFVIVGAIIIALIGLIPWVGPLAVLILVLLGVGALVRTAGGRLRTPEARRAVTVAAHRRRRGRPRRRRHHRRLRLRLRHPSRSRSRPGRPKRRSRGGKAGVVSGAGGRPALGPAPNGARLATRENESGGVPEAKEK